MCLFCYEQFGDRQLLTQHQDACNFRAFGLETLFKLKRQSEHSKARQRSFLERFDIVSVDRAAVLSKSDCQGQVVCDLIVVEDSDEDDAEVELPTPPTSPLKLFPSSCKNLKRTSSLSPRSDQKKAVVYQRESDVVTTLRSVEKLLRIDLSSPLGQRLRDHVDLMNSNKSGLHNDERMRRSGSNVVVPNNMNLDDETSTQESPFGDRLRQREWQVTFRPNRQHCRSSSSYSHVYRFSRWQRAEFCRAFDCGLSVRARRLLKKMKPCRVIVHKLSPKVIAMYRSNTCRLGSESGQNRLVLRIPKSVISLTKCDYLVTKGVKLDVSRCDLNRSEGTVSDCQTVSVNQCSYLSSPNCNSPIQKPPTICQPSDSNQCLFDSEPLANVRSAPLCESSVKLSQPLLRQCTALNGAENEKSDLLSVNSVSVHNDNTDAVSEHSVCVMNDMENCSQLLYTTDRTSDVARNIPILLSPANADVQTIDTDCRIIDSDIDSMGRRLATNTEQTSEWSMSGNLPALSFLCSICGDLVDCECNARSLIYEHYAGHGITNIELMEEITPSGDTIIKLIELPISKTNSSCSQAHGLSTSANHKSRSNSILVRRRTAALVESVEFDADSSLDTHTQKKRRRVTWADEVLSQSPQASNVVQQFAMLEDSPEQQATISNYDDMPSTLYCANSSTIPRKSIALPTTSRVAGSSMSSTTVLPVHGKSSVLSFPVITSPAMLDTESTTIQRSPSATAESGRRVRMFWSNSNFQGGGAGVGDQLMDEQTPRRSCSTARLSLRKGASGALLSIPAADRERDVRSADGVCLSRKSPQLLASMPSSGQLPVTNSIVPSRNISFIPHSYRRSRTEDFRLNSCHSSYQQETNVICID